MSEINHKRGDATEVSININPACRGRGLGHQLLADAMAWAVPPGRSRAFTCMVRRPLARSSSSSR